MGHARRWKNAARSSTASAGDGGPQRQPRRQSDEPVARARGGGAERDGGHLGAVAGYRNALRAIWSQVRPGSGQLKPMEAATPDRPGKAETLAGMLRQLGEPTAVFKPSPIRMGVVVLIGLALCGMGLTVAVRYGLGFS